MSWKKGDHCEIKCRGLFAAQGIDRGIFTDEQTEFIRAVEAWKKKMGRRFPATTDYLAIAKSLGYEKS